MTCRLGSMCTGSYAGRSKDGRSDVLPARGPLPAAAPRRGFRRARCAGVLRSRRRRRRVRGIDRRDRSYAPDAGLRPRPRATGATSGSCCCPAGVRQPSRPAVQLPRAGYLRSLKACGRAQVPDGGSSSATARSRSGTSPATTQLRASTASAAPAPRPSIGLTRVQSLRSSHQNRNGVGTGSGLCFGDSGSPQLERGTLRLLSVDQRRQRPVQLLQRATTGCDTAGGPLVPGPVPHPAVDRQAIGGGVPAALAGSAGSHPHTAQAC